MRRLLVLRPEPGASATAARALALGLDVHVHSIFAIEPVAWTMPDETFDGLLLTSANAVRHAGTLPPLPAYAVGEATAEAARGAGAELVAVGAGGLDDLLRTLPPDLHLLHLAAEERLEPTASTPRVTAVPVYRAVPRPLPDAGIVTESVLLVHSPAAGHRVAGLAVDRSTVRIAAISPAAASACGTGWKRLEAAQRPSDAALLSLAAELCKDSLT